LPAWSRVLLRGEREEVTGVVRAVLAQLAVAHSPQELVIAFCVSAEQAAGWDWAKWLPHTHHPSETDGA
ncbi:hypothetical protein NGM37_05915, partial [Streptomyces sp. TRM76130]|nr:hypothetical protein [Streptomyces sp. TRM76130]